MKIVLVTGANRGLGFETSKQLAELGFKVYMGCRDEKRGTDAVNSLLDQRHNVEFVKLDVTKTKDIRNFQDHLKKSKETLDVLINNAGVFLESVSPTDTTTSSLFKVDPVIVLKSIETNTVGPFKLIQSLVPVMLEKGQGRVINISSGMGVLSEESTGHWPGYRMSKTALNGLTRIVHGEVGDKGISVNSVCPGWVRTDMGGEDAVLSADDAVKTIIWLSTMDNPPSGKFFRDKKEISW